MFSIVDAVQTQQDCICLVSTVGNCCHFTAFCVQVNCHWQCTKYVGKCTFINIHVWILLLSYKSYNLSSTETRLLIKYLCTLFLLWFIDLPCWLVVFQYCSVRTWQLLKTLALALISDVLPNCLQSVLQIIIFIVTLCAKLSSTVYCNCFVLS